MNAVPSAYQRAARNRSDLPSELVEATGEFSPERDTFQVLQDIAEVSILHRRRVAGVLEQMKDTPLPNSIRNPEMMSEHAEKNRSIS